MPPVGALRIGTSSFTATGWRGTFYPEQLKQSGYLNYYATQFDTVEIDSTWYGPPKESTVLNWAAQTPERFRISAKVPQVITHERCLNGCEEEMSSFLKVMERLGPRLGTLLFQFPYFQRNVFATPASFLQRLAAFLSKLSPNFQYAVEIRNKDWLTSEFTELLKAHRVALALVDHPWMPSAPAWFRTDPVTAQTGYVRLLGDRYAIEARTKFWDKVVVDRSREISDWVDACEKMTRRGTDVFVYITTTTRDMLQQPFGSS